MNRQKSLKQFGLQQLIGEDYHLNTSSSVSVLNQSSFNNISESLNSNKIFADQGNKKINHFNQRKIQTQKQQKTSLIKSKEILQKLNNKLQSLPLKKPENSSIQFVKGQIYETTYQIAKQIDKKIENTFAKLLNNQTAMPIAQTITRLKSDEEQQKQNFVPNALSYVQGTKMLMTQFWEKENLKNIETPKLQKQSDSNVELSPSLPKINERAYSTIVKNQNQRIILGKVAKHEKKRQEILKSKDEELKLQFYTFTADIIDYKIRNESKEFLLFQRMNFKKWEDILFILQCLEKFCQVYKIPEAQINLKRVLELMEAGQKRQKLKEAFSLQQQPRSSVKDIQTAQNQSMNKQFTTHQLLNCFEDAQKISETHPKSKGIRFFGNKGKKRAIIKIQSHFRRYLCRKKFQQLKKVIQKVTLIQKNFRSYLEYCKTKQKITEVQMEKIQKFKQLQKEFRQSYRKNEITKKIKYEIHVCSISSSEWQRVTTQNINQRQNTELSRIFRLATKSTPLIETRIIYIAPNQLSKQILNYYKKIFQFGSSTNDQQLNDTDKLTILWPEHVEKLPQTLTLTQKLMYSKSTMKRLKRLIKGNYSYIVPSKPSNDFVLLSSELNVPLYSSQPQKLLYLQTKAGSKEFSQVLKESKDDQSFGMLPYSMNIYNRTSFINQLTFLVFNYPSVRKWVLKIDNQNHSRGLAYIDTSKIIKSQLLARLIANSKQKGLKQEVYSKLYESLVTFKEERIIPVNKEVYRSQEQFLNHFLAYGGIIEASINNFESDLENHCFVVEIEPDFQWKFITSFYKITNKNKTIGCYYDSTNSMQPPIQIEILVKQLVKRKLFGFFTFEFLKIPQNIRSLTSTKSQQSVQENNLTYFNSIKCHLNELSSASFLKEFLSKDTNVLYIPFLPHPSLKQLRIQTFFHLCRLQNISFDIKRKIGNVFMFLNGLQSGCMGLMSFNGMSKQQTFQQVSDVLEFLGSKINQSKNEIKHVPKCFMSVRNVVNGFLKKQRNSLLTKISRRDSASNNLHKTLSAKELI